MKKKSVLSSIISISLLGIVAKVSGLLREGVTSAYFGTSSEMDVYSLLCSHMGTIVTVIASSISVAYMPYFITVNERSGSKTALKELSGLMNQYIIFSVILYLCIYFLAPIVPQIDGFSSSGIDSDTIVLYTRILFSTIIFTGLSRIQVAALSGVRKYGWMQITSAANSIIFIIFIFLWGNTYGIMTLVVCNIFIALLQFVILQKVLYTDDCKYSFSLNLKNTQTINAWKNLIPVFLGTETYLLGLTIDRTIGMLQGQEGVAASFNYAGLIYGLTNTILVTPIITVFYTELNSDFSKSGKEGLFDSVRKTISRLFFILLPFSIYLCINSNDVITFILQRGAFDEKSSLMTSQAFCFYALSIPLFALRALFSRIFVILNDSRTSMFSGLIFIAVNIIGALFFGHFLGIYGISLGSFAASFLSLAYMYLKLNYYHLYKMKGLYKRLLEVSFATILSIIPFLLIGDLTKESYILFRLVTTFVSFVFAYITVLHLMKHSELLEIEKIVINKIKSFL